MWAARALHLHLCHRQNNHLQPADPTVSHEKMTSRFLQVENAEIIMITHKEAPDDPMTSSGFVNYDPGAMQVTLALCFLRPVFSLLFIPSLFYIYYTGHLIDMINFF